MKKYIILIKIIKTQKVNILKKKIIKKLKEKNNLNYKINIYKEKQKGLYKIKINLKDLLYSVDLEHLVVEALESFEIIKISSKIVSSTNN